MSNYRKICSLLLILFGSAMVVGTFVADFLGIGPLRWTFLLVGLTLLLQGIFLHKISIQRNTPVSSIDIFVTALWFGLLCGILEGGLQFTKWYFHLLSDFLWMPLVSNGLLFAVFGLIAVLLQRLWPGLFSPRVVISVIAFLGFLYLQLLYYKLNTYIWLIIAAGLAILTSGVHIRYPKVRLFVRRTTGYLVVFAAGLILALNLVTFTKERSALAGLPDAPAGSPNVLLIVLDTVRAKSLSLHGYERSTTPQLERLAQKGTTFENAWSPSPWTLPAHGSLFTGRLPFDLSDNWKKGLGETYTTLAEVLRDQGFSTAGFAANLVYCTFQYGIDRGFIHYEDFPRSPGMFTINSHLGKKIALKVRRKLGIHKGFLYKDAAKINHDFLGWLSQRGDQRPFFAFLNYIDAHSPYHSPPPFDEKFGPKRTRPAGQWGAAAAWWNFTMEQQQGLLDAYEGAIAYVDHQLGLLFEDLQQRGVLENTVVIITSDHGELFGEHKIFGHGNCLYQPVLHVPLMISYPSHVPASKRIADPVTLCDIPATILDLLDLDESARLPGTSLAKHWADSSESKMPQPPLLSQIRKGVNLPKKVAENSPYAKGDMYSIIVGNMHYIRNGDGSEELYNLDADPDEKHNLAVIDDYQDILQTCRDAVDDHLDENSLSGKDEPGM